MAEFVNVQEEPLDIDDGWADYIPQHVISNAQRVQEQEKRYKNYHEMAGIQIVETALESFVFDITSTAGDTYIMKKANTWSCTCPDFIKRCRRWNITCKHIIAVQHFLGE